MGLWMRERLEIEEFADVLRVLESSGADVLRERWESGGGDVLRERLEIGEGAVADVQKPQLGSRLLPLNLCDPISVSVCTCTISNAMQCIVELLYSGTIAQWNYCTVELLHSGTITQFTMYIAHVAICCMHCAMHRIQ